MTETTNARQTARQAAAANGWELEEGRGTDVFSRGAIRVAARWNAEGRLTNLGARDVEIDKAYTAVKGGRAALADLLTVQVTQAPAEPVQDETNEQEAARLAQADHDQQDRDNAAEAAADAARQAAVAEAPAGFVDSQGTPLAVGDTIEIVSKGNNVRKQDVGAVGVIVTTTRSRLRAEWTNRDESTAPRWPVLPALVTRQG